MDKICTVLLISYNHEKYIEKAIKSVLEQETEYPYIIKIFDDCSTDNTKEIIEKYADRYPDLIELYINNTNKGAQANIWEAYNSVDTKYCALLECDDEWTDKHKLQSQIKALENNPDCSFCAHNTLIKNCGDSIRKKEHGHLCVENKQLNKKECIVQLSQLNSITNNFMNHINSRLIRMSCIDLASIKHKEAFLYDNCQFYYLLSKGNMYYIPKVMSLYKETGCGVYSGNINVYSRVKKHILSLFEIEAELGSSISRYVYKEIFYFLQYYRSLLKHNIEKPPQKSLLKKIKLLFDFFT